MIQHWHRGAVAAGAFLFLGFNPALANAPGVLWETTSQMVMEGLPFSPPPTTLKLCKSAQWNRPPPGGDSSCVHSNYQRVGNKATWTMQCSGEMPMTGTGEMTFAADGSYTGAINATADGVAMKIVLSGKKIGTCDKPVD